VVTRPALPPKDSGIAYVLLVPTLFGVAGLQHFYLGRVLRGILWLLTWGLLGIGSIYDLFTLKRQTRDVNARRAAGID
jgi:TM2 domain-containing membrane protein YozV